MADHSPVHGSQRSADHVSDLRMSMNDLNFYFPPLYAVLPARHPFVVDVPVSASSTQVISTPQSIAGRPQPTHRLFDTRLARPSQHDPRRWRHRPGSSSPLSWHGLLVPAHRH